MKILLLSWCTFLLLSCQPETNKYEVIAELGQVAPSFNLVGHDGKEYNLEKYRGKLVVLEWLNHGCPFVKKHYNSGNMQKLQEKYTGQDVVWLSIISSAEGNQGYVSIEEAASEKTEKNSKATAVLLDPTGKTGQLYGAKTTPHMFVLDKEGKIVYQGAIDDKPSTQLSDINGARNYVAEALDALSEGRNIAVANTKAYGCSVKY